MSYPTGTPAFVVKTPKLNELEPKISSLSEEMQTEEIFDHDIVGRMGHEFYREVFAPAIKVARE